jgi:hypothetical protein
VKFVVVITSKLINSFEMLMISYQMDACLEVNCESKEYPSINMSIGVTYL